VWVCSVAALAKSVMIVSFCVVFYYSDDDIVMVDAPDQDYSEDLWDTPSWLRNLGMGKYSDIFLENDLTSAEDIAYLTDADLEKIGVGSLGHRKKILREAKKNKPEEATGSDHSISSVLLGNVYIHTYIQTYIRTLLVRFVIDSLLAWDRI